MAASRDSCQSVGERLVDFADGELSPAEAHRVAEHLAACETCRRTLAELRRSLELARHVWSGSAGELAERLTFPLWPKARRFRAAAAAAACVLLAVGAAAIWRATTGRGPAPGGQQARALSEEEVQVRIQREDISAQLAASAQILSLQPGGKEAAERALRGLARRYPETSAGKDAARRFSPNQGAIQ